MTTTFVQPSGIDSSDPRWDTISSFTGKPLTQKAKEANDRRRRKNQAMLDRMYGGLRLYRVNRQVPIAGTKASYRCGPRTFWVKATSAAEARAYVQEQIDGMIKALPGKAHAA